MDRLRRRLKLSKNEGVPDRTPCGECGEPLRRAWTVLFPTSKLHEVLRGRRVGGPGVLVDCFQPVRGERTSVTWNGLIGRRTSIFRAKTPSERQASQENATRLEPAVRQAPARFALPHDRLQGF